MNFDKRAEQTLKLWGTLMMGLVFSMLFTSEKLGVWSLGLAALIVVGGIATTGFMWNWGEHPKSDTNYMQEMDVEKAKRSRLSLALRDLSDSELANLRQRLAAGDIDEGQLARLLEESELDKAKRY
jgi:hypothetical protein